MLIIRLQRTGKKNAADFRIVLAEKESHVSKKFQEVLGSYNPRTKMFQVKTERVQHWISKGVALSPTVHNLFVTKSLTTEKKVRAFSTPKKPVEVPAPEVAAKVVAVDSSAIVSAEVETPAEVAEATTVVEEKVTPPAEQTAADVTAETKAE